MEKAKTADTHSAAPGKISRDVPMKPTIAKPVRIHYGGREYMATPEMAGIFVRRTRDLVNGGDSQLVPLLHHNGVELLLITTSTPVFIQHPVGSHPSEVAL